VYGVDRALPGERSIGPVARAVFGRVGVDRVEHTVTRTTTGAHRRHAFVATDVARGAVGRGSR